MANLFKRSGSPFWWIKYRGDSGQIIRRSTGFRCGVGSETKKAIELCAEKSLEQARSGTVQIKEKWPFWTDEYLAQRYARAPNTLLRYRNCLRAVLVFLNKQNITAPRLLRYQHVMDYITWRKKPDDPSVFRAKLNTILTDIKVLRIVMREAVRRGYASDNPCLSLGIKKEKSEEKPEITDKELEKVRKALKREPSWMQISFEIAIHQGCRLRETCLPLSDVDLARMTITFNAKGGKRFTTALHPGLVPMMQKMKARELKRTCEMPHMPSKAWWKLFKRLKMKHLCFHCTRVTVITRLARAGVPMAQAMRFVGHASETIHRVYQRLGTEDLSACVSALSFDAPSKPSPSSDKRSLNENQGVLAST